MFLIPLRFFYRLHPCRCSGLPSRTFRPATDRCPSGGRWRVVVCGGCAVDSERTKTHSIFFSPFSPYPCTEIPNCYDKCLRPILSFPFLGPCCEIWHVNLGKGVQLFRSDASTLARRSPLCALPAMCIKVNDHDATTRSKKGGCPRVRSSAVENPKTIVDLHLPRISRRTDRFSFLSHLFFLIQCLTFNAYLQLVLRRVWTNPSRNVISGDGCDKLFPPQQTMG